MPLGIFLLLDDIPSIGVILQFLPMRMHVTRLASIDITISRRCPPAFPRRKIVSAGQITEPRGLFPRDISRQENYKDVEARR